MTEPVGGFRTVLLGVLRYVLEHPDAKDTIDGIAQWWGPAAGTVWPARELHAVLEFMAARTWVTVRPFGERDRLYSTNSQRLDEMRAFLAELERRRPKGQGSD